MMDLKESCGSQGSQESSSLHPTSWQAFAHTSTLHGLRYVFPYGQPSVRRLLWAAALLACLGLLALESAERLAYFLSYPHVTSVDAVVSSSLVFPAVTICNLNAYRFSRLTRNDLYHAGELMALLDVHLKIPQAHLAEPDVLASLQEKANFTKYKPTPFSMKEFIERVGHDLREMMLYCRYQGQECSPSDFKTVSPLMPSFKCQLCSGISWGQSIFAALQPLKDCGTEVFWLRVLSLASFQRCFYFFSLASKMT
ncbi:acid-sensing ion channel 2-like isoform X1 [Lates calcarifer]|uniref:Acid-sensing ion channel 2-like isoform X1 n=1 Tax=Lates calcarifer TaxID=8187 RepID=A0AAJ7PJ91_LATCA|nr:acid-sensing ion channel 2-like isoform X1 [Lates calcarifer]XP_018527755.1 acid-sensing ion channel 2-like isoform X1 [Lates calcarifer]